jgi:hypothetical protein
MAGKTVFFHCRVLEQIGSALVCMTAPALHVHGFLFDHRMSHSSVWIMATGAGDLSFDDWMMRRLVDLHARLLMAANAGLVFQLAIGGVKRPDRGLFFGYGNRRSTRGCLMHGMAIITAHIVARVAPRFPESQMPVSGMATHTGLRLLSGGYRAFVETYGMRLFGRIAHMVRIISVAG